MHYVSRNWQISVKKGILCRAKYSIASDKGSWIDKEKSVQLLVVDDVFSETRTVVAALWGTLTS